MSVWKTGNYEHKRAPSHRHCRRRVWWHGSGTKAGKRARADHADRQTKLSPVPAFTLSSCNCGPCPFTDRLPSAHNIPQTKKPHVPNGRSNFCWFQFTLYQTRRLDHCLWPSGPRSWRPGQLLRAGFCWTTWLFAQGYRERHQHSQPFTEDVRASQPRSRCWKAARFTYLCYCWRWTYGGWDCRRPGWIDLTCDGERLSWNEPVRCTRVIAWSHRAFDYCVPGWTSQGNARSLAEEKCRNPDEYQTGELQRPAGRIGRRRANPSPHLDLDGGRESGWGVGSYWGSAGRRGTGTSRVHVAAASASRSLRRRRRGLSRKRKWQATAHVIHGCNPAGKSHCAKY